MSTESARRRPKEGLVPHHEGLRGAIRDAREQNVDPARVAIEHNRFGITWREIVNPKWLYTFLRNRAS